MEFRGSCASSDMRACRVKKIYELMENIAAMKNNSLLRRRGLRQDGHNTVPYYER